MISDDKEKSDHRFQDLDWRILQNGAISLFFHPELLDEAIEWFRRHEYLVYTLDCREWKSEEAFHADIKQGLNFPDYYGTGSLAGFNDCLIDIEVPEKGGTILVFVRFDVFDQNVPQVAQEVLDIIERNSRLFLLMGRRLIALVQSDDPHISFRPVGCNYVQWNPKEWLDKERGS